MEYIDPQTVRRVFQRVRGGAIPEVLSDLPMLLSREVADLDYFCALLSRSPGDSRIRRLQHITRRQCALLRGICRMAELNTAQDAPAQVNMEHGISKVRYCYGRVLERMGIYDDRRNAQEYGCAFAALADGSREQACLLLELLGSTPQQRR